jgi:hypothetical protein
MVSVLDQFYSRDVQMNDVFGRLPSEYDVDMTYEFEEQSVTRKRLRESVIVSPRPQKRVAIDPAVERISTRLLLKIFGEEVSNASSIEIFCRAFSEITESFLDEFEQESRSEKKILDCEIAAVKERVSDRIRKEIERMREILESEFGRLERKTVGEVIKKRDVQGKNSRCLEQLHGAITDRSSAF